VKIVCSILFVGLLATSTAHAQFGDRFETEAGAAAFPSAATPSEDSQSSVQRWKIGFSILAKNGPCGGIFATVPVPTDWPEQSVRTIDELTDVSPQVSRVKFRTLSGGVKQMLVTIPNLRAGDEAHAFMTFEVTKKTITPPENVESLSIPSRIPRTLRPFIGTSPYIESTDDEIEAKAAEIVAGKEGAWERVEAIYDWVRANVEYKNGPIKGALAAFKDGDGDCEELTSLFVAFCRANDIPARAIWLHEHCYPEFYLMDAEGKGHWIPCQAAGTRNFGGMFDKRPILQKGDKFKVPETKRYERYVKVHLSAKSVKGSGGPEVKFVREEVSAEQPFVGIR